MNKWRFAAVYGLLMIFACLCACGDRPNSTGAASNANAVVVPGENANTAKTNAEELELLVNIPFEVDDVVWKEDAAHKKVIAVLHFSKSDADRIVADAAGKRAAETVMMPSEPWYPAELIAQSEMSGDEGLKGTAYSADAFFMEPYTTGRIVRIEGTDYFVLQLAAK
jgi:hypothetical protein